MLLTEGYHTNGKKINVCKIKSELDELDLIYLNHFYLKSDNPYHDDIHIEEAEILDYRLLKKTDNYDKINIDYPEFSNLLKKNITMDKDKIFFFIRGISESPLGGKMKITLPIFLDDDQVKLFFTFVNGYIYKIN